MINARRKLQVRNLQSSADSFLLPGVPRIPHPQNRTLEKAKRDKPGIAAINSTGYTSLVKHAIRKSP